MRRRTFFKSILSNLLLLALPRWARSQTGVFAQSGSVTLSEIAAVVLPASLGPARTEEIVTQFQQWIQNYPAGADAGYGYGHPHPRLLGPDPSIHYADQLKQIGSAASAKGVSFAALDNASKRAILEAALANAGVTTIPMHPTGQHAATDLMSFFYNGSSGEDFCYNVAIQRDKCRGLATSGQRPASLS